MIFNGMKIAHSLVAELVRSMLREGLKKKREDRPRRITGSPSVIDDWADNVQEKVQSLNKYHLSHLARNDRYVSSSKMRRVKRIIQVSEEEWRKIEAPEVSLPLVDFSEVNLGRLSNFTADPHDRSQVNVQVTVVYFRSLPEVTTYGTFRNYLVDAITPDVRQDSSAVINCGEITIMMGLCGVKEKDGERFFFSDIRSDDDIRTTIDHEVLHLMQYLANVTFSPSGMYARYGRRDDRPGAEQSTIRSSKKEHNQSIAIEPDAYVVAILKCARQQFNKWFEETLNRADNDVSIRSASINREIRSDMARLIINQCIVEKLGESHGLSGAGRSSDVRQYVVRRSLNAIEKIVASSDFSVAYRTLIWKSQGWKQKPYTPHLDNIRMEAARKSARKEMIIDVVSLLEEIDDIILGSLADTVASVGSPGNFENDNAFDAAFRRDWFSKKEDLLRDLQDVTLRLRARRRAFERLEDSIYFPSSEEDEDSFEEDEIDAEDEIELFVESWFDAVREDVYNRSAEESVTDPLIPSLGTYLDGDDRLLFSNYRKFKSLPYIRT